MPGGLISLGTYLDPALTKGDLMVGSLIGQARGRSPLPRTHFSVDLQLFDQAVGSVELLKVEKVRMGESLRLNIGTAATLGTVTSVRETIAELDLRKPVVAEPGARVAISRRIAERWRLIGSGPGKVRRPRKVLFDSSFLIAVMEHPTPWQGDITGEGGRIRRGRPAARLRRAQAARGKEGEAVEVRRSSQSVWSTRERFGWSRPEGTRADEELVSHALREGAVVATIDGELIATARGPAHVEVLSLGSGRVEMRQN